MPVRAKNPVTKREDFLAARPRRAAEATIERKKDGGALVKIPVMAKWLFRLPAGTTKSFELDEMGLCVWDLCDGKTTMLDVITKVAEQYGLSIREAEVSTTKFLEMLAARRLIGILVEEKH